MYLTNVPPHQWISAAAQKAHKDYHATITETENLIHRQWEGMLCQANYIRALDRNTPSMAEANQATSLDLVVRFGFWEDPILPPLPQHALTAPSA